MQPGALEGSGHSEQRKGGSEILGFTVLICNSAVYEVVESRCGLNLGIL